jgi:N-acyl-D-aspartate/D-glutamate deacylase
MHTHSDLQPLAFPGAEPEVMQGVTTEVIGQDGLSFAPADAHTMETVRERTVSWNGERGDPAAVADGRRRRHHDRDEASPARLGRFRAPSWVLRPRGKAVPGGEIIRRMPSLPQRRLGQWDRGAARPGFWADLAAFDPAAARDTATYEDPKRFPEGIPYVMANGTLVKDEDARTGAAAGLALRMGARL